MRKNDRYFGADDLEARLAKRYKAPEYAFMTQVCNSTGFAGRRADALALGLYPSRGLHLHGFEIKVNRGDWLNELKRPEKADEIAKHCDFWWIVAPEGIVRAEDPFPATWGLLEPHGDGLRIKTKAPPLQPDPIHRGLMAAIFRRFAEDIPYLSENYVPKAKVQELAAQRAEEIAARRETRPYEKLYEALLARVTTFEEAVGLKAITERTWEDAETLGKAFRVLIDADAGKAFDQRLSYEIATLQHALESLTAVRSALQEVKS